MKAKLKAEELILKFSPYSEDNINIDISKMILAKQCALIAVDEIRDRLIWHTGASDLGNTVLVDDIKYWEEVKTEINEL